MPRAEQDRPLTGHEEAESGGLAALRERAGEMDHQLRSYVQEHPLLAVGIALGVGYVVGWSLRRMTR